MKKKKIICIMLIFIFTSGIVIGAIQLYKQYREYSEGEDSYTDLEDYVKLPEEPEAPSSFPVDDETESGGREWPAVDFASLQEINPDIVGWIYIEGTEINYPVVQGNDNQYYLKHLFSGEWNGSGCIFLDSRNRVDFSDRHSIIYGHHKLYIIVKGGRVEEIYSTKTETELYAEILDFDSKERTEEMEKDLQFRYEAIRELMYRID